MAADKKTTIIIKKKKGGGGHGHHGGAWKVAYADFVTAMMAFFLVMWLMGSDEETKSAVSHYFNHPNTPYKAGRDPASEVVSPLGEQDGSGDLMLKGQNGAVPEDQAKDPGRKATTTIGENRELAELIKESMDGKVSSMEVNVDSIQFSIPETVLFEPGTTELSLTAGKYLQRIGKFLKRNEGYITIAGHSDDRTPNSYEFTMARAVAVMNYLVEAKFVAEERITPQGTGPKRALAANEDKKSREKNRRIEFTLTRSRRF